MSESVKKILEPNKCPDYSEEDMAKILTHGISALRNGTWQNLPLFLRNEPVHEKAVILSVFISGLSYQTPADFKRLEALYVELCAIIKRFFGSDQTLTIAPNGEKFFVTFGGSRLEEKNEDRALECAELIREAINQTGLTAKFGVASGQMCYLPVGGKYKEPSPFGNGFNTSARIAAGPLVENNDIWVEGQVARRLPDINWSRSEVVRFKGQSIDRQICLYGGKKNPDVFFAPLTPIDFLGRQEDVQNLDRALNTDGLTYVGGLTGSGKSSLIGYYLQNYVDQETKIVGAQSNFYDRAPYEGIRFCLYQLADIVPSDNLSDKKNKWDKFYNQVFPNDNFSPQKISLDMILGLIPESKETDLSFNLLRSAVANLLQAYSKTAPLYLVLENAHYLDSSSRTLIQQVLAELGPESGLKWIVAGDEKQTSENFLKSFPLVSLGLFSSAEAKQFILNRLSSSLGDSGQLSEAVYQYLEKKSGRNPALLSELCDLLLQSDLKDPRQKKFLAPDDVNVWDLKNEAELNSIKLGLEGLQDRIGLLSKGPKEIIEWAGFLGETFSKGDILTLLPLAGVRTNPDEVAENFEELVKAGLLIRTPETEDKYCFSHGHIPLQIQEKMGTQARFLRHLLLTDTLYKDEPQAAFVHYREALQNKPAAKPEEGIIRAFIENGLEVAKMAEKELDPEAAIKIYHELEAQTAYLTENESALLNYRLGENYALLGNIEKAMEYYEKYREVTEKNLTPAEELGVVFALCQLYKKRHNPTDLETIKNLTSKTNRKLKGKRYQETLSEADLKKWTYYLREAKTLADSYDWFKEKDPLKKARLLAKLTQKKEALYKKIKADFEGFSDELAPELIRTSNNLAMLYKRSGNKEKAEQVLLEAENMGEKLLAEKDLSLAECQLIGDTVMQLIYLYSSCDKNKMAAYQDKAKQLLKPTNLLAYIQTLFCMSESIPLEAGSDLQKKYDLNIESYRLSKQINHDDGVIYSLANLIQWLHYMIPITSEKKPELTSRLKNFFNMIQTIFAKIDMKQSENQKKFAGIPEFLKEMEEKYQG